MLSNRWLVGVAVPFAASVLGCATVHTLPSDRLSQTQSSLRAAQELGAEQVPDAALHARYAQDELQQATALARAGEDRRASLQMDRADVDAQLAYSLAREAKMKVTADEAAKKLKESSSAPSTGTPAEVAP